MFHQRLDQYAMRKFRNMERMLKDCSGNISILAVLSFIPVLIAVTAAVDLSNAIRIKASLQAAADAGVLAAATALASGYGDADKQKIAEDTFYANLSPKLLAAFPATPDVSIDFSTQTVRMDVVVDTDQLLTNLITDAITIGVTATAMADKGSPVCLMALNKTASGAIHIQGTADVNAEDCAVYVNSNHDQAMEQVGNAYAVAEGFCVHGSYSGSNYTPTPRSYCMREQDPLAAQFNEDLADVDLTTCRSDMPDVGHPSSSATSGPGVYCGGLNVKGALNLEPGIHVFRDGELEVRAGGSLIGDGVTVLLTGNSNTRFINQAGSTVDISAPAAGPFAGIVMAQNPTSVPSKENVIIGGGYMEFNGVVYYPNQKLKITGNGSISGHSSQFAIIADTIDIEGNGVLTIKIGADYLSAGLPALPEANQTVRLVH
jgi:Flp pilus assembly protein TadG